MGEAETDDVTAALQALDAARQRFVAVVGHELRTPVTTLRGLAEELAEAGADQRDELGPAILRNARRVEMLLDDLLLATDIITALPVGDPEPVDLVATAQATWDAVDGADELLLSGDTEAVAMMRPGAADTLLHRLLDNARRYGEAPFSVATSVEGGRVTMEVSNAGGKLEAPRDDVGLAFELFYRGEAAVTSAPGFGLGLPVARALARHDGGDLHIAPRAGGGLVVTIDLPTAG